MSCWQQRNLNTGAAVGAHSFLALTFFVFSTAPAFALGAITACLPAGYRCEARERCGSWTCGSIHFRFATSYTRSPCELRGRRCSIAIVTDGTARIGGARVHLRLQQHRDKCWISKQRL